MFDALSDTLSWQHIIDFMNIHLPIEELNLTFLSYSSRVELFIALIYSNVCPIPYVCQVKMPARSEEHTSELQSRETISYAVFCLKKKKKKQQQKQQQTVYRF